MSNLRIQRLEKDVQRYLSQFLQSANNVRLHDCNITAVRITNDLSYARVYYTLLSAKEQAQAKDALRKASGYLRFELAKKLAIRKIPELQFREDQSALEGNKIADILNKIKPKN